MKHAHDYNKTEWDDTFPTYKDKSSYIDVSGGVLGYRMNHASFLASGYSIELTDEDTDKHRNEYVKFRIICNAKRDLYFDTETYHRVNFFWTPSGLGKPKPVQFARGYKRPDRYSKSLEHMIFLKYIFNK